MLHPRTSLTAGSVYLFISFMFYLSPSPLPLATTIVVCNYKSISALFPLLIAFVDSMSKWNHSLWVSMSMTHFTWRDTLQAHLYMLKFSLLGTFSALSKPKSCGVLGKWTPLVPSLGKWHQKAPQPGFSASIHGDKYLKNYRSLGERRKNQWSSCHC